MKEQVKTADIIQIKSGEVRTFVCRDWKHCESVKSLAYRAAKVYPELGVKFKCKVDYRVSSVRIEAIPI